jgi:predicted NUDIX family phosphoesterase
MNDTDAAGQTFDLAAYHRALQREIAEELRINSPYQQRAVALLNDDSTEVGKVHIGVVHVFECETDDIACGEAAITDLAFLEKEALRTNHEFLETWSQICMDSIDTILRR